MSLNGSRDDSTVEPPEQVSLERVLSNGIANVRRRVENAANLYRGEIAEGERAADRVLDLQKSLGLGAFKRSLTPDTGKPQFLLVFDRDGAEVVLKAYGRTRPGEGALQYRWTQAGAPCVPTLAWADEPTSWLLMTLVPGHDLSQELTNDPGRSVPRTVELAAVMQQLSYSTGTDYAGARSLVDGVLIHLDAVVMSLTAHRYTLPPGWREHAIRTYCSGRALPLHGDLFGGNVRVQAQPGPSSGQLLVIDTCGYVGDPAFDAARWTVRTADPSETGSLAAVADAWREGADTLDERVFAGHLAVEALMQAGVREIVKDEQGLPWHERDAGTLALLDVYDEQTSRRRSQSDHGDR